MIMYEELEDTSDLVELCEVSWLVCVLVGWFVLVDLGWLLVQGIRSARAGKYPGHLKDEMHLYRILIKLFRDPAILMRLTKGKLQRTLENK